MAVSGRVPGGSDTLPMDPRSAAGGRWPGAVRNLADVALIVGLYLLYEQIRMAVRDQRLEAFHNATQVVRLERAIGIFNEVALQRLVLHHETLIDWLDRYYATVHFPLTVVVVIWAYVRHRGSTYRGLRFLLISVTLVALACHVTFPLAPPRMLPHLGFVDTLAVYGPDLYSSGAARSTANQFAAMPSLHFGWAVIVAWSIVHTCTSRWRHLAWLHPAVTLLAITATANHYWLDSIIALAMVLTAWVVWRRIDRAGSPTAEAGSDQRSQYSARLARDAASPTA